MDAEFARRNDGDGRHVDVLIRLGDFHQIDGAYRESEKCYSLGQAIALSLENTDQEGSALFGLGTSHTCQHRYDQAEECFAGSRSAFATVANQEGQAKALECLAEVYILQDKFQDARVASAEARDICTRLGRPIRNICLKSRRYPRNLEEMDALIRLNAGAAQNAQDSLRAGVLTRFAYDHLWRDAYDDAEECFRLAETISSNPGLAHERGIALIGLGALLVVQKRNDEAEECFVRARVAFASIAEGLEEAKALDALTMVFHQQNKLGEARRACMEARDIYLRTGQPMSKLCADAWERLQGLEE